MLRSLLLAAAFGASAAAVAATSPAQDMPAKVSDGALVAPDGMTLYTFDRDVAGSGKSVCNGACATLWPALTAQSDASGSGDWKVITRDDGGRQWAYKGKPVYRWSKDAKPGDRTGDGFNNAWRIARP